MRIAIPWQDFYSKCMNKPLLELAECHLIRATLTIRLSGKRFKLNRIIWQTKWIKAK